MKIITIEKTAIDRLKAEWPCHGISDKVDFVVAAFHNGDLVDIDVCDETDVILNSDEYDGAAFTALLHDAQRDAVEPKIIPGTIPGAWVYK